MDVFDLFAKISLDTSEYDEGLRRAAGRTKDFGSNLTSALSGTKSLFSPAVEGFQKIEGVGKTAGEYIGKAAKAFGAASVAVAGWGGTAVKAGMSFDATMSQVSAISGATGSTFDALRDKAIEMGAKTQFSATEAAEAMTYMAMAGWKDQDMLNGIAGIMDLAAASGEDLASTSDIVTDALTAFGMQASESGHFADVLAVASSNANTNVGMMGETFKYVAPVAGSLGYTAEDTALAIGLMANSGIKASQAGTSLRSIITRLSTDAGASSKSLGALGVLTQQLGVEFYNTDGTARSLNDVIMDSREAWSGLSEEQQVSYAKTIAGQEAMSAWLALMNAAPGDVEKLTLALEDCDGAAKDMAETMLDNLAGDMKLFESALESLQITVSDALNPTLREFAQFSTNAMEQLTTGFQEGGTEGFFSALTSIVTDGIAILSKEAPRFVEVSLQFVESVATGILNSRNQIILSAQSIITTLIEGADTFLTTHSNELISFGLSIVRTIFQGFSKAGSVISEHIGKFIPLIAEAFLTYHSTLFTVGLEILGAIGKGLVENKDKIQAMASNTIQNLAVSLRENAPAIIEGAIALVEALAGAVAENWPLIMEVGAEIIGKLVEGIMGSTPSFIGAIALLLPHINNVINVIGGVGGAVLNIAKVIGSGIGSILSIGKTLMSGLSALWALLSANPIGAVVTVIGLLVAGFIYLWNTSEGFREFWIGLWENLVGAVSAAWEGITGFFSGIGNAVSDFWGWLTGSEKEALDTMESDVNGTWDSIEGSTTETFGNMELALSGSFDSMTAAAGTATGEISGSVDTAWTSAALSTDQNWGGMESQVVGALGSMSSVTQTATAAMGGAIDQTWTNASASTELNWLGMEGQVTGSLEGMTLAADGAGTDIFSSIDTSWTDANTSTDLNWEQMVATTGLKSDAAVTAVDTNFSRMENTVMDNLNAAKGSAMGQDWTSVGINIVDGMSYGVRQRAQELAGSVANAAIGALNAARSALDINSPSKKSEWLFEMVMRGGVVGVEKNAHLLTGAMEDVSAGLLDALRPGREALDFSARPLQVKAWNNAPAPEQSRGGDTYNFYSPKALDSVSAARELKKARQQMALNYV